MCQQINNNYYGNDHVILLLMSYTPTIKHWFLLIAYLMKPKPDIILIIFPSFSLNCGWQIYQRYGHLNDNQFR